VLAWVGYALAACAGWAALPAGGFWINDEGVKYLQMRMINTSPTRSSALRLDVDPAEAGGLLPQTPDYLLPTADGYRFFFPDHFARSAALVTRLGGETGARLVPLVAGLVAVAAWSAAAWGACRAAAPFVPLLVVGSPWMFYHWVFWEHTSALLFEAVSLLVFLQGWRARAPGRLALAGALLGLGVFLRLELALYAFALVVAFALVYREWRRPLGFALGAAAPVLALLAFNAARRGHPLGPAFFGQLAHQDARWRTAWILLVGLTREPTVGLVALAGVLLLVGLSASRQRRLAGVGLAGGLLAAALVRARFLARPDPFLALNDFASAVTLAPILFSGLAVGFAWGRGRRRRALATTAALYVGAAAAFCPSVSAAGIHWGPRMLFPALVPAVVLAAERLAGRARGAAWRLPGLRWEVAALLLALGLGWADTAYGWRLLRDQREHTAAVERYLADRPERYLVTNVWWVPQLYARAASAHAFIFLREGEADYTRFRAFAAAKGERAWLFAAGPRTWLGPSAEPLAVPGAPFRATVLDARFYRVRATPPSP
jgi:hypothetical protein